MKHRIGSLRSSLRIFSLLGMVLPGLALSGCSRNAAPDPVTKESFYFDTVCDITIYDMDNFSEDAADTAIDNAFSLCSTYENMLSKTVEGSDIWNINHAGGKEVTVNQETADLISEAISYCDLSGGRFDITIGKAEDLWGFDEGATTLPDPEELEEAVKHIDYKKIKVSGSTVQLEDPDAEIDLGGIAKGYIADRVADNLSSQGVTSAIVSLGGNIECVGEKPQSGGSTAPFTIGIETPYSDRTEVIGSLPLSNGTAVTSGVYERYITVDGKQYFHILDPDTGYPVDTDVISVTITADEDRSVDCDALSTTCLLLGTKKGTKLIESLDGYEAAFIDTDGNISMTDGMEFTPAK
jgi:thiamine biosynthesis lipoprotein